MSKEQIAPITVEPSFDPAHIGASLGNIQGSLVLRTEGLRGFQSGDVISSKVGPGIEIDSLRPYEIGDDIRKIDWRATARDPQGELQILQTRDERNPSVFIVSDIARTPDVGMPSEYYSALTLGYSALAASMQLALRAQNPVGVIATNGVKMRAVAPATGKAHILQTMKQLTTMNTISGEQSAERPYSLAALLGRVANQSIANDVVVVISRFRDVAFADGPNGWKSAMRQLSKGNDNDVIAVEIQTPVDRALPQYSNVFTTAHGAQWLGGNKLGKRARQQYSENAMLQQQAIDGALKSADTRHITLATDNPQWASSFSKQLRARR